ncbi:tyrosine-type recombinase/integrase [Novosphingobium sp. TCA1]|jgi:integrase|uniref:tyrosine-type recombinase/integrase n=1 Tax=Novosphingobium sp. TCA1 TaxID=2682474 RepID=UPI001308BCBE|nr:tyrosine-type recombinase/integrase [Novosphingobium sp. TCA1]GFE72393.1 hypothetical protein NTCA1_00420 [Novosphingobium sp. TCA1]
MKAPILADEQFDKLYAFVAQRERPAMYRLMLLLTQRLGLRPVELANMESSWVRHSELRIPQGSSKGNASRTLPLSAELLEAFEAHMQGATGRVFTTARRADFTRDGISEAIRRIYRLAGVTGSAYCGRRTAATKMVDRGISMKVIQDFLGHSNLATTAHYLSSTPAMLATAIYG